ncbi:LysR family transcriptional regulator [Phytohalomonas tamaricis]|uniref:LysR family transcriptional regulator n=1 Tax=Phytohalomonas tamaricis TaxID=2081032 RepID=UPI000D0AFEEC|nr:LysR family transcriptional regulator [Phytohalomonas tamaricis]
MRGNEFAELQAFVAVAERGSFVRAAEALQVTPSALSQTIRGLEARLNIRLFNRTTRSVRLTTAGARLFKRLQPVFEEVTAAVADAASLGERPSGRLKIHAFRLASQVFLEPAFEAFLTAYPDIVLDVTIDDSTVDIVAEGYDAALRLGELLEQDMVGVRLGPQLRQIAVASPDYIARHGKPRTPSELHQHRCINWRWPGQLHPYQWEFKKDDSWFSVAVHGPLIVNDQRVALEAAVNGIGIAFWAEDQMAELIRAGKLVPLLDEWCAPFDGFFLCYPQQRHHLASLRAFVDFFKQRYV